MNPHLHGVVLRRRGGVRLEHLVQVAVQQHAPGRRVLGGGALLGGHLQEKEQVWL